MSNAKNGSVPHVEVDDPEAAFHRLEDAARRLLAVPKKELDKHPKRDKVKKRKTR
jgi:hypothetical protein